jgi:predicted DNA-binding protein
MSDSEKRKLTDQYLLRLPDGMRERIKRVAEQNKQSMNSAVLDVLEHAFPSAEQQLIEAMYFSLSMLSSMEAKEIEAFTAMFSREFNKVGGGVEFDFDESGLLTIKLKVQP